MCALENIPDEVPGPCLYPWHSHPQPPTLPVHTAARKVAPEEEGQLASAMGLNILEGSSGFILKTTFFSFLSRTLIIFTYFSLSYVYFYFTVERTLHVRSTLVRHSTGLLSTDTRLSPNSLEPLPPAEPNLIPLDE